MGRYFYRISLMLVVALAATACVPVSRAQGLEPVVNMETGPGQATASVQATERQAMGVQSAIGENDVSHNTLSQNNVGFGETGLGQQTLSPAPIRLYQPQVLRVAQANPPPELTEPRLFFDLSLQPQLIELFNERALENDIARIEHVAMIDLLDQITTGRKLIIFKNAADAEELVPTMANRLDFIGYNLEGGPSNRPDEQADPVGSARRVRMLADSYGLKVALGPSRDFALNYGAAMAPYVDLFVLQVQRVQDDHETVQGFVLPLVQELLAANPALEISVQIRTEGDVGRLVELVESLGPELAGVSILTSQDTLSTGYMLYDALDVWRWTPPPVTMPTPDGVTGATAVPPSSPIVQPTAPEAGVGVAGTPTAEPRRTPTQAPEATSSRPPAQDAPTRWFLFGSGLLFGLLLAMLGGTWLMVMVQRTRTRTR